MSYDSEHYYAVQTFLEVDELIKIWNIIEIAMNREGYDVSNAELSMRLSKYLTENIETKTVNLTLTFDERSELLRHLEMFDENIDQLHPLVESVQDKLLGID